MRGCRGQRPWRSVARRARASQTPPPRTTETLALADRSLANTQTGGGAGVAVPQQGLGGGVGHEPFEWAIAQLARQSDQLEEQLLRPSSRSRKRRADSARELRGVDRRHVL